ncbi:uncharacterized protein L199_006798 [Kwoniella botswanensis]|uniref:uncharacterized protein n=1 Tax=Kwoniella botswanensis TaxID=1268659 RepID=UPI00315DF5CD
MLFKSTTIFLAVLGLLSPTLAEDNNTTKGLSTKLTIGDGVAVRSIISREMITEPGQGIVYAWYEDDIGQTIAEKSTYFEVYKELKFDTSGADVASLNCTTKQGDTTKVLWTSVSLGDAQIS